VGPTTAIYPGGVNQQSIKSEERNMSDLLKLASRTNRMKASIIRETLKVVSQPGMISLAGGIPAPESFPLALVNELTDAVLTRFGSAALQYGPSEGSPPLREALVAFLGQRGIQTTIDNVVVTCGSQGALDTLAKIFISPGDKIVVEAPTYLGAISAFNPYEPDYVSVDTDDDGVIPESLDDILTRETVKFVYVIPSFQNPTGRTLPLERRKRIAEIVARHNVLLVEDDAYYGLRYRGEELPPIKTMAPDHVAYLGTFSKTLAPGLRVGICCAPREVTRWMVLAKQGVDLHTNSFAQALTCEYISSGHLERHLPNILNLYRPRQEAMLESLETYLSDDYHWVRPDGGMFIWVEGPEGLDTAELYWKAIDRKVAYVPGTFFYTRPGDGLATMRLNYTMCDEKTIRGAVETLASVLNQHTPAATY
jgi:2-aminoadipate transaminase